MFGFPRRLGRSGATGIVAASIMSAFTSFPSFILAAQPPMQPTIALVVGNDRGGLITDRLQQMRQLLIQSQPVEIRGDVCYSTCTMLLGLPDVCVSPQTAFGFHGPSESGRILDTATFETASQIIAGFYPSALRDWYLSSARYQIENVTQRSGADLIAMGVKPCAPHSASLVQ